MFMLSETDYVMNKDDDTLTKHAAVAFAAVIIGDVNKYSHVESVKIIWR